MFSIILSLVLFLIQIPIKTFMLALKTGVLVTKFGVNKLTEGKDNNLKNRLNNVGKVAKGSAKTVKTGVKLGAKTSKTGIKLGAKATKLAFKAVKLLIRFLTFLLILIKTLITFLIALGLIGIIILIILIVILASTVSYVAIASSSSDGSGYGGNYSSSSNLTSNSSNIVVNVDTSSLYACCETMANWYIANIDTYQQQKTGNGSGSRKGYTCDILDNKTVYDDCTGFAAAYAQLVSGKSIVAYGSKGLYLDGKSYINAGWTKYNISDIGGTAGLLPGDILVCNDEADTKCKGHHAEIYLGESKSFGWGKIQSKFPSSTTTLKDSTTYEGYIEQGTGHRYGIIFRYTGSLN